MSSSDYSPLPTPPNPAGNGSPTIVSPTAPMVKALGTTWMNPTTGLTSVWDGTNWVQITTPSVLPPATTQNQILVSDAGLSWQPGDLDQGRY